MGRAPCCEKVGLKRGRWTAEEDEILSKYIQEHGEGSWRSLPKNAGLLRCGKSCRLRWINYLRSDLKRGNITPEEEDAIIKLHTTLGNRWSVIAGHLAGRTDNEIKNYWNSHLSRKIGIPRTPMNTSPVNMGMEVAKAANMGMEVAKAAESSKRRRAGGRPSMRMKNENRPIIAQKISMPEPKEVEIINNVTAPLMPTTPTSEKETSLSNAISWTEENLSTIFAEPCEAQEHSNQVMAAYEMCFDDILCNWEPSENPGQAYHSSPAVSRSIDWDWNFDATENGGGSGGGSDTGGEKDGGGMLSWLWDGDSWEGECNTGGVDQTVDFKKQSAMVAWLLS